MLNAILAAALTSAALPPTANEQEPSARFQRDVLPILSDKCFLCHGPDASTREAGLRLDLEDAARSSGVLEVDEDGYSELLERIREVDDPNYSMPPPEANLALSDVEKGHLEAWIRGGAPYEPHWAFVPLPKSVPVPEAPAVPAALKEWSTSPLDRFVRRGHLAQGLEPAAPASRERWLRRVTFDLTGLPPTLGEMDAFLRNDSEDAREEVVDRLLASPRFGERMATPWLDAARYADSYGYQSDLLSPTWPYRDWVVRALNDDLPYDEFLTWQLAGDLLPEPVSEDQLLATAFQRLHRMTNEGGSVGEEWTHAYVVDRVETLGGAVLGLTLGCARCHDHKYDPVSQSEFYGLFAFFNSIDEAGMYHDSSRVPTPSLLLPSKEARGKLEALEAQLEALADSENGSTPWQPLLVDSGEPEELARFSFDGEPDGVLVLDGDKAHQLDEVGTGLGPLEPFQLSCRLWIPEGLHDAVILHRSGGSDVGYFGFDLVLADGELLARQVRFWPGNAAAISAGAVPRGEWVELTYAQKGTGRAGDMALWIDGKLQRRVVRDGLKKLPKAGGSGLSIGARFRGPGFAGGQIDELAIHRLPLSEREEKRRTLRGKILRLQTGLMEVPVMEELASPRAAHTLARGAYDAPRTDENLAPRGFPASLGAAPATGTEKLDRLSLARWLVAPEHPLTARVAANRIWQVFFGTGLVATADDFGLQGSQPSHPELLDWLARRLVDSGWSHKAMCREVALSATYAQDSVPQGATRTQDPENRWLARGPSRRLSAEMLRDACLSVAGVLDERMGGPPVSPYQPPGLWRESNSMSPAYRQSVGNDLYRRSLYSVVKRTAPLPNMLVFDRPMRETSCARRESTATPLQGLVLLNDIQFVEAAGLAADRAAEETDDDSERIERLFRRFTGRAPDPFELTTLLDFLGESGDLSQTARAIQALDATVWKR